MAKKGKENKPINVIDLRIADASDEELTAILEVRKKYSEEERNTLITGLIYIAEADGDYSAFEKQIVESTACTLGFNQEKLDAISGDIRGKSSSALFTAIKNTKFRDSFFTELISLSYIKGYQTQAEDDELRKIASIIGVPEKKTESMIENMYFYLYIEIFQRKHQITFF